jgi:hypothetical protein
MTGTAARLPARTDGDGTGAPGSGHNRVHRLAGRYLVSYLHSAWTPRQAARANFCLIFFFVGGFIIEDECKRELQFTEQKE